MDDQRELVTALCKRMKDDSAEKILATALALKDRFHLTEDQSLISVDLLCQLSASLITEALDLAIEITREEWRSYDGR